MISFVLINNFLSLTSFTKTSILDVVGVVDLPTNALYIYIYIYLHIYIDR